ncbi:MAG: RnfABCDGE type electron transport complex subunit D [Planctomycetes bacterium]|nr:RnfABCDGE type electron transport complex subunit D [Planctomycetota bacterium]
MTERDPQLLLQAAPFLRRGVTTPGLMVEVTLGLVPVIGAAIWFFGVSAVFVLAAATAGAVGAEWLFGPGRRRGSTLGDGSAVLTGLILGLCLPPGIALWMAFLGGAAGIGLGKIVFGGLGQNLFNPALVGRAFLQAAFPTAITTWTEQGTLGDFLTVRGSNLAVPLMQSPVDAVSTATPLGLMKFEGVPTPVAELVLGNTAGSLGETCGVVIIVCGLILAFRRLFDWRIPVAILGTVAVLSAIIWAVDPEGSASPTFMLFSGGLLFGSVYMATDPVTSPISPKGAWIFGAGVGALVVLIRRWGGQPEGVMYAILLMNATTPLIDRITQPRGFGRGGDEP